MRPIKNNKKTRNHIVRKKQIIFFYFFLPVYQVHIDTIKLLIK